MIWFIPILGLIAGISLGSILAFQIPIAFAKYLSIAVLASLDSIFGGIRGILNDNFNGVILLTGFVSNALIAALLAFLGDQINVDLYMAAVFVFGVRIFNNLSAIRHSILTRIMSRHNLHGSQHQDS